MASLIPFSTRDRYGHRVLAEWSPSVSNTMLFVLESLMWAMIPLFESTPALARRVLMQFARRLRLTFSFLYLLARMIIIRPSLLVGGVEEGALGPLRGGVGVGAVGAGLGLGGTMFLRALWALLLVTVAQDGVVGAGAGEEISSSSSVWVGAGATYFLGPSVALRGARLVVVAAGMSESEDADSSCGVGGGRGGGVGGWVPGL